MSLSQEQKKLLDQIFDGKYRHDLYQYLDLHDVVGDDIFKVIDFGIPKDEYSRYIPLFNPMPVNKFILLLPFFLYKPPYVDEEKYKRYGTKGDEPHFRSTVRNDYSFTDKNYWIWRRISLNCNSVWDLLDAQQSYWRFEHAYYLSPFGYFPIINPEKYRNKMQGWDTPLYDALVYMYWDLKIPIDRILDYTTEQCDFVLDMKWFHCWNDWLHYCNENNFMDFMPDHFPFRYNRLQEDLGKDPVVSFMLKEYRSFNHLCFSGLVPYDGHGPVLKYIKVRMQDVGEVYGSFTNHASDYRLLGECEGGETVNSCSLLVITLTPSSIVDAWDEWRQDWTRVYSGPAVSRFRYEILREKRNELHLTQQNVADAVGVSVRTYQKWESGDVVPEGYYLLSLMKYLDLKEDQVTTSDVRPWD